MINIWLIITLPSYSFCKQIFIYNDDFLSNELTLIFPPYELIDIHINKRNIRTFFTTFDKSLYLDIFAINSKGKVTSYGPYKNSDKIAGVHFYNRQYILKFANYGDYYSSLSMLFSEKNSPVENISKHYWDYPISHIDLVKSGPGKPIIYEYKRVFSFPIIAISLSLTILLLIALLILDCCQCFSCCNKA